MRIVNEAPNVTSSSSLATSSVQAQSSSANSASNASGSSFSDTLAEASKNAAPSAGPVVPGNSGVVPRAAATPPESPRPKAAAAGDKKAASSSLKASTESAGQTLNALAGTEATLAGLIPIASLPVQTVQDSASILVASVEFSSGAAKQSPRQDGPLPQSVSTGPETVAAPEASAPVRPANQNSTAGTSPTLIGNEAPAAKEPTTAPLATVPPTTETLSAATPATAALRTNPAATGATVRAVPPTPEPASVASAPTPSGAKIATEPALPVFAAGKSAENAATKPSFPSVAPPAAKTAPATELPLPVTSGRATSPQATIAPAEVESKVAAMTAAVPAAAAGNDLRVGNQPTGQLSVQSSGSGAATKATEDLPVQASSVGGSATPPVEKKAAESGQVDSVTASSAPAAAPAASAAPTTHPIAAPVIAAPPKELAETQTVAGVPPAREPSKPAAGFATTSAAANLSTRSPEATSPAVPTATAEPAGATGKAVGGAIKGVDHVSSEAHKPDTQDSETGGTATNSSTQNGSGSTGSTQGSTQGSTTTANSAVSGNVAPPVVIDPGTALAAAMPPPAATPISSLAPNAGGEKHDVPSGTVGAAAAGPGSDTHALPSIDTARVIQSMQGSEMRVGMRSAEFGNVSVSTTLNRESIAAQISFEHADLGKAITAHLPSIEAKLSSDYGMHAKVEVRDQSMGASGDSGRGESRRGDAGTYKPAGTAATSSTDSNLTGSGSGLAADNTSTGLLNESARLDVRV